MLYTLSDDPTPRRETLSLSPDRHARARALRHDKFYTCTKVAEACLRQLADHVPLTEDDFFVEPAAGSGAFLNLLPAGRCIGLDIAPDAPGIWTQNFLHRTPIRTAGRQIVVGNPPFGRNGKGARDVINHAAKFADVIAFILPASFRKASVMAQIDPCLHLVHQCDLPPDSFTFCDEPRALNTVFMVFERRDTQRITGWQDKTHPDFDFVRTPEEADFAIRRVGVRAGCVIDNPDPSNTGRGLSPQSNYFLKAQSRPAATLRDRMARLEVSAVHALAVGPASVSKGDLVAAYRVVCATDQTG